MSVVEDGVKKEIQAVVSEAVTEGSVIGRDNGPFVFEYEVDDGVFLGVAPREEEETVVTVFIYVADVAYYTTDSVPLNDHPVFKDISQDIAEVVEDGFSEDIKTEKIPSKIKRIEDESNGQTGSYFKVDLPRDAFPS